MFTRRSPLVALLLVLALFAAACGSDEAPLITTEELLAPTDDALNLNGKPPVDESYLVPIDELTTTDLIVGDGDLAEEGTEVFLQYVGVLADGGRQFDASWDRGAQPFSFVIGIGGAIQGWDQGVRGMRVGGRRVLQIPAVLAYGDQARGADLPANSDLVFIVDLVDVQPGPEPAPTVPEDALGSFDELNIEDLVDGNGRAAEKGDILVVNYVGVRAEDGVPFDSSWLRNEPFRVIAGASTVIEGWKVGMLGIQPGTERILQIPSAQAYGEGDLVFRVHAIEVIEAPASHLLTFDDPIPDDIEMTTLVEGSGREAEVGNVVNARVIILRYSDSDIFQSSYADDSVTPVFISPEDQLPIGLREGFLGIKGGETRQVIVPATVAFPDGIPENAGLTGPDDGVAYIVEAIDVEDLTE